MKRVEGFSTVESFVALGIASVAGLAVLGLTYESAKSGKNVSDLSAIAMHQQFILQTLGAGPACAALITELGLEEFTPPALPPNTLIARHCPPSTPRPSTPNTAPTCVDQVPASTQPVAQRLFAPVVSPGQALLERAELRGFEELGSTGQYTAELSLAYRTLSQASLSHERRVTLALATVAGTSGPGARRIAGCGAFSGSSAGGSPAEICQTVLGGEWDAAASPPCLIRRWGLARSVNERSAGVGALASESGFFVGGEAHVAGGLRTQGSVTFEGLRTSAGAAPAAGMVLSARDATGELIWSTPPAGPRGPRGPAGPPGAAGGGGVSLGASSCPSGQVVSGIELNGSVLSVRCAAGPSAGGGGSAPPSVPAPPRLSCTVARNTALPNRATCPAGHRVTGVYGNESGSGARPLEGCSIAPDFSYAVCRMHGSNSSGVDIYMAICCTIQ